MKKQTGMRPHDIVVLLKIAIEKDNSWYGKDLAFNLGISASEISESLNRSVKAGLLANDKKRVMRKSLLEFLEFGFQYVFPQSPGAVVRGIPTAYSAPPLSNLIQSENVLVWPNAKGTLRGETIEPLHPNVPEACLKDKLLYELLSLLDALRIGRTREKQIAIKELKKRVG